jgi:23S rRNA (uracil1939-C5)-methyltransferase
LNPTKPPIKAGESIKLKIENLAYGGEGVGRIEGYTVFVPYTAPGDEVMAKIILVTKRYAVGRLERVIIPSPDRAIPPCPIYYACGGCQLQHIDYPEQLQYKKRFVQDALSRIGGLPDVPVLDPLDMESPYAYRNKIQHPLGKTGNRVITGFYRPRSHDIVRVDRCLLYDDKGNRIISLARDILSRYDLSTYDERSGRGLLRHLVIRRGLKSGECSVTLVVNGEVIPHAEEIARELMDGDSSIVGVMQSSNTQKTNRVLGEKTLVLAGRKEIKEEIGGVDLNVAPETFLQVNTQGAEVLYRTVADYVGGEGGERVLDLYCGVGAIALILAKKCREVYGVDASDESVAAAMRNASANKIDNVHFVAGKAEDVLPGLVEKGKKFEVVVVDPPRRGCDRTVIDLVHELRPRKIVYVSCDPSTLARDLALLNERGYWTARVQPVDMFPQTYHIECVAEVVPEHPSGFPIVKRIIRRALILCYF